MNTRIKNFYDENRSLILIFLIWLVLLLIVGSVSTNFSTYHEGICNVKKQLPYYRWDSFWYTSISRHGYTFSEVKNSSIAFFPLYPIAIRLVYLISHFHEDLISLGLNVIFSFLAALFLYRLARMDYSEKISLIVVALVLFFPPSYFFLSGYPESMFVLLGILSLYFARRKKWMIAGLAAGLLAITKPYGIFMLPVLIMEYLWSHRWDFGVFLRKIDWLPLVSPVVSFGGFVFYNYWKFKNPVAFLDTQKTWGRSLSNPLAALYQEAIHYLFGGHLFSGSNFPYLIYLTSFIFSILAFRLSWNRVRKSYLLFSGLLLLSALLTGTLTSWGRYTLLAFPILIGPAVYFSRRKSLLIAYLTMSGILLIFSASFFVRCFPFE